MADALADDVCRRCGLGAEPATWYCGACWYVVSVLRDVAGESFDRNGDWPAPAPHPGASPATTPEDDRRT